VCNRRLVPIVFATALCLATLCLSWAARAQRPLQPPVQPSAHARVDINRATLEELLTVPGMTRVWAVRIVRFRPYRTKIDLMDRGIVSSAVYDRIKDSVVAHRNEQ
jgi:DNA uptake protein ComE-like DNA-binding protein